MSKHDNVGLVTKYLVFKREDGRWMEKETASFVLSPNKNDDYGKASQEAIIAYAKSIKGRNRELAKDLLRWVAILRTPNRIGSLSDEQIEEATGVKLDEP